MLIPCSLVLELVWTWPIHTYPNSLEKTREICHATINPMSSNVVFCKMSSPLADWKKSLGGHLNCGKSAWNTTYLPLETWPVRLPRQFPLAWIKGCDEESAVWHAITTVTTVLILELRSWRKSWSQIDSNCGIGTALVVLAGVAKHVNQCPPMSWNASWSWANQLSPVL
jgi:hypothetical protein